ncbi:hypothetical protein M717_10465 [Neisseria gonorrhoeae SK33414]|nr:hypothetical protein M717_10465 [Neisseria gonorrhoeae SK33414]
MVPTVCKFLGTVDAATGKTARVRLAAAARAIGINNTVRHDFLFDGREQRFRLGIVLGNGIGPPVAFRNAEDNRFSCRAATASAFTPYAETASARPGGAPKTSSAAKAKTMVGNRADFTVKQCRRIGMDTQNIGGRTGGNFRYKRTERVFLYFFL